MKSASKRSASGKKTFADGHMELADTIYVVNDNSYHYPTSAWAPKGHPVMCMSNQ